MSQPTAAHISPPPAGRPAGPAAPRPLGWRPLALVLAGLFLLTGCPKKKEDDAAAAKTTLAEDGTDASDIESHASALTAAVTLSTGNFEAPARAALAATATKNFFFPAGCVTTETSIVGGATAVHKFNGCSGPWGLARVSGTVRVEYSATTDATGLPALKLEVTGDGLTFRRATADFHATAVLRGEGASREMSYSAQIAGQTARGRALERTADWRLKWTVGETCLTVDGTTQGNVSGKDIKTTVENYERCRGECPASGKITLESSAGEKLSIEFDGSSRAKLTVADGTTSSVRLACGLL